MGLIGSAIVFVAKTVVFITTWHVIGNAVAEVAAERREKQRKQETDV